MTYIDGSIGEGGGQIIRTALSLSAMLREIVSIENIRANRAKPGLKRQHLTAVRALAEICNARLEGDELNSQTLVFEPREIKSGDYHFDIGSAGSAVLVAQTIIPVLLRADAPSTVTIEGGTHVSGAPIFEFFDEVYLPQLRRMGCDVTATLERYGFFPVGGGRIRLDIRPGGEPKPYVMHDAGAFRKMEIVALSSGIDRNIAQAEAALIAERFCDRNPEIIVRDVDAECAGNAVYARLEYENITEIFSAIGALGLSRKAVAQHVTKDLNAYLCAGAPVGKHLADQLLLPMLHLGCGGVFTTGKLSLHTQTNLDVLRMFESRFEVETQTDETGRTEILSHEK